MGNSIQELIDMKILYIINKMTNLAGIERILTCKMNYLSDTTNYQVFLTTYEQNGKALSFPLNPKIIYQPMNAPMPQRENQSFISWLASYFRARKIFRQDIKVLLKEFQPDILICTNYSFQVLDIILNISQKLKIKTVLESHTKSETVSMAYKFQYHQQLYKLIRIWDENILKSLKYCQCVVTLTKRDIPFWQQNAKRIEVIPNMLTITPKYVTNYNAKRVISAGRYMTEKGFDRLLSAWHLLPESYNDWSLYIFGNEDRTPYQHIVDSYRLSDKVHLMPATNNIADEFSMSSLYVMTSRYEGFGLVLAEAMSCGLPCIAFDCPYGPREIITNGDDGILVKDGDIEELATQMQLLMSNADLRKTMGEKAIKNIGRYNPERIMDQWDNLLNSI